MKHLGRPLAGCVAAAAMAAAGTVAAQQPRLLAVTHATVLDVRRGSFTPDATVVVQGRTIVSVGAAAPPPGAQVVDARGTVVLPGLIDAHAHISDLAGAKTALLSGVTTARSAGVPMYADVALREMVKSGHLAGPDVIAAGVHLQPHLETSDVLSDPRLFEFVGGAHRRPSRSGARPRSISIMAWTLSRRARPTARGSPTRTRGTSCSTKPSCVPSSRTAQRRGIPVETHAHGDEGAANAVRAGVRSIEHGTFLSGSDAPHDEGQQRMVRADLFRAGRHERRRGRL